MRRINLIPILILIIFISSCDKERFCVDGAGPVMQKTIELPAFTHINFTTFGNVEIIQSNEHKVVVEAEENIVGDYRIHISGVELDIEGMRCFNTTVTPKVYVYCNNITQIRHSGSGEIKSTNAFNTGNLDIKLSGSGNISLFSVQAKECDVKISGSGDVELSVSNDLQAKISGSGNVFYKGTPAIHEKISGSGRIISAN